MLLMKIVLKHVNFQDRTVPTYNTVHTAHRQYIYNLHYLESITLYSTYIHNAVFIYSICRDS